MGYPIPLDEGYVFTDSALPHADLKSSGVFPRGSPDAYCLTSDERGHRIVVIATSLVCAGFGVQLIAGIICFRVLWISRIKSKSRPTSYLVFHTLILGVANLVRFLTAILAYQLYFLPLKDLVSTMRICLHNGSEIDQMHHLVGIFRRFDRIFKPLYFVSVSAIGISGFFTDIMLIWRCRQIWKFTLHPRPNLVVLAPTLLFVGSTVLYVLFSVLGPRSGYVASNYYAVTLTLNVLLTSLIVFRLWQSKVQLRTVMGDGYGKHYNLISTVFVESAFMNAVCSILLLASALCGHADPTPMASTFPIWLAITPAVQACSNYLIIYRGAKGWYGSWSNNVTAPSASTTVFKVPTPQSSEHAGGEEGMPEV